MNSLRYVCTRNTFDLSSCSINSPLVNEQRNHFFQMRLIFSFDFTVILFSES